MNVLRRFFSVFVIIIITLVLCEAGLRLFRIDLARPLVGAGHRTVEIGPFLPHPTRFWSLTPLHKRTEANAQGFRGPDISLKKPPNVYRIFCLGNSCTYGTGCYYSQTYPARLQELLDAAFGEDMIEVINAGVPGYSTLQELRYLQEDLRRYDPDMLIVQFGENDQEGGNNRHEFPAQSLRKLLSQSRLMQTGYNLFYGIKKYCYTNFDKYHERIALDSYGDCLENLTAIDRFARENGIRAYYITPTWFVRGRLIRKDHYLKDPRIDLYSVFKASGMDPSSLYLDSHHWLPPGHLLVASAICRTVSPAILADMKNRSAFDLNVNSGGIGPAFCPGPGVSVPEK